MTKIEKTKEFVNIHKKEIALTTLAAATAGVGIVLCKKLPSSKTWSVTLPTRIRDLTIPENLKTCTMTALWKEGGCINSIVNDVCLSQLGEFGIEMIDNLGCIEPNIPVSLIIGFPAK